MERTDFVLYAFICKGGRSRLAEENNTPLSSLSELQALVIDLVCQLACRGQNNSTDALPYVCRRA